MYPFHSKKLQGKGKTEMPVCSIDFGRSFRNMMIGELNSNVVPVSCAIGINSANQVKSSDGPGKQKKPSAG